MTNQGLAKPDVRFDAERLKAIYARTVEKLQEVVREFKVTQDELHAAGDFLNRLGRAGMCRSLLDVALAMTSVDATARAPGGTRPNLEGPFRGARPLRPDGNLLDRDPGPEAPRLTIEGVVRDAATGQPIPQAQIDVWQADHRGHYDNVGDSLRGVVVTDCDGRYAIKTVVPKDYSEHDNDPIGELFRALGRHNRRAAHIHIKISVGGEHLLTTQLFIPGSDYLDSDYVEGAVSPDLILDMKPDPQAAPGLPTYRARFDFDLVRPAETASA